MGRPRGFLAGCTRCAVSSEAATSPLPARAGCLRHPSCPGWPRRSPYGPPMARPATPSRAPAGAPRPPPPAWQASPPRSLSRPARCGTAAVATRVRTHSGGGGGCRRKTGKACVGPGATRGHSGGAEVPEAQAVVREEGWGSPGPHRTPCSVWRGTARRYPQGPAGAPFTRAQGQHQLGSARLSQEKASSWGPPHQGTLASAVPLPPIP